MPELLVAFRGPVSCHRAAQPPALILSGHAAEPAGEAAVLTLSAAAPAECPAALEDARVERLGDGQYRITSAARSWLVSAAAAQLHFEIAAEFYRAIPPRRAPPWKRLFWRLVLTLAGSRTGLAALKALRR
jgi:hypothetical protein